MSYKANMSGDLNVTNWCEKMNTAFDLSACTCPPTEEEHKLSNGSMLWRTFSQIKPKFH